MKLTDNNGKQLDAEFVLARLGESLVLTLESRGGGRNNDYRAGLELLLDRLGQLGAVLEDIQVSSRDTATLPDEERRVPAGERGYPITLTADTDASRLRLDVQRAVQELGRKPGAKGPGNREKRLSIRIRGNARLTSEYLRTGEHASGAAESSAGPTPGVDLPRQATGRLRAEVFDGLTRKHVLDAMGLLDQGHEHPFSEPTTYEVVKGPKRYPPKAVFGLAAGQLLGRTLLPGDFSAGDGQPCFRILRELGFSIEPLRETAGVDTAGQGEHAATQGVDLPDQSQGHLELQGRNTLRVEAHQSLEWAITSEEVHSLSARDQRRLKNVVAAFRERHPEDERFGLVTLRSQGSGNDNQTNRPSRAVRQEFIATALSANLERLGLAILDVHQGRDGSRKGGYQPSFLGIRGPADEALAEAAEQTRSSPYRVDIFTTFPKATADIQSAQQLNPDQRQLGASSRTVSGIEGTDASATRRQVPSYFALLCNPNSFDIQSAAEELDEGLWQLPTGDPSVGDRLIIWKAKGHQEVRGIACFAEVLEEAEVRHGDAASARFFTGGDPGSESRRIRIKYVPIPSGPLWMDENDPGLLGDLSVAGGQGNKLYHVSKQQWEDLLAAAGGWPGEDSVAEAAVIAATAAVEDRQEGSGGQGFGRSAKFRRAVELHAMSLAETHFESLGYSWEDTSANKPYDLVARRGEKRLFVEVKGTTTEGEKVFLTKNEIAHARSHAGDCVLFMVRRIAVTGSEADGFHTQGGEQHLVQPWVPASEDLTALSFQYVVPES
ncbi:DUF3883 domain-containing protein [Planctomycetota bacterium]|nr:DUF3883 domain-containing protein [Planctomycetota bacterium]